MLGSIQKKTYMSYESEFEVVDLIINSSFETRGVDAFSLAVIKSERQLRRLFTFLIYQNPTYNKTDSKKLKEVLCNNKNLYFKDFIKGINKILSRPINELYGEDYENDYKKISEIIKIRNKVFHGQLTSLELSRTDLFEKTDELKIWCKKLSTIMINEIGYDGFERNSYQKSKIELNIRNLDQFDTFEKFRLFIENKRKKNQQHS